MLSIFTKRETIKKASDNLFIILSQNARNPIFFGEDRVSDSPDGRFELISLFAAPIFLALANRDKISTETSQLLFDKIFISFDDGLRRLGVSDMAIAKRIQKLSESFYGRQKSYKNFIIAGDENGLAQKIALNIFNRPQNVQIIDIELSQTAINLYTKYKEIECESIKAPTN